MMPASVLEAFRLESVRRWWLLAALGLAAGFLGSTDRAVGWVLLLLIAIGAAYAPYVLPALLLAGPAFLHVISYYWSSAVTRADVLSNPLEFLPVLLAFFVPPLARTAIVGSPLLSPPSLRKRSSGRWLMVAMLALAFMLGVRTVGSPSPIYGATKTFGFLAFSFLPSLFVLLTVRSLADVKRVLDAILVIGGTWIALALFLGFAKGDLNLYQTDPGLIFGSTNQAGGGLAGRAAIVAIIAVARMFTSRKGWLFAAGIGVAATLVIVLAGHRGSLLGLLGSLVLLSSMLVRRPRGREVAGFVFALLLMSLGALGGWRLAPEFIRERYRDPLQSTSFLARISGQQIAFEGWKSAPLFGNGTGSSAYLIALTDQPTFGIVQGIYPHNVVVELLAEVGV